MGRVELYREPSRQTPSFFPGSVPVSRELKQRLAQLHHGDHVCSFYKSQEEEMALVVSWIAEGLSRGEGGICVTGDHNAEEFSQALAAAGVDVEKERRYGSLLFVSKWNWRIEGEFNIRLMAQRVAKIVRQGLMLGNRGLWLAVDMTWALNPDVSPAQLSEWEAIWNDLILVMPAVLLCQYDEQHFAHDFLHPQFLTHPFVIRQGKVYSNFYYNPSEVLSERRNGRGELIVGRGGPTLLS